jgi:hypothetical protein
MARFDEGKRGASKDVAPTEVLQAEHRCFALCIELLRERHRERAQKHAAPNSRALPSPHRLQPRCRFGRLFKRCAAPIVSSLLNRKQVGLPHALDSPLAPPFEAAPCALH